MVSNEEPKPGEIWQFRVRSELAYTCGYVCWEKTKKNQYLWAKEVVVDQAGKYLAARGVMRRRYYVPDKKLGDMNIKPTPFEGVKKGV